MQNHSENFVDRNIYERLQDEADLRRELASRGYVYLRSWSSVANAPTADAMAASFGNVLQVTDVKAQVSSSALVTSCEELAVHTDHSRARYIMWHCVEQSDEGGETVLVDTQPILEAMTSAEREALKQVYLTEHRVFRDDPSRIPLLRTLKGEDRVYYSFWLLEDTVPFASQTSLARFQNALKTAPRMALRLEPGDVLIIDNHRMLHGRTAIGHGDKRHLVRYWIGEEPPKFEPGVKPSKERRGPKCPAAIQPEQVQALIDQGVDAAVARIDLSMVKMKLQDPTEGKGWTLVQCEEVELEYKRFLTLNLRYPEKPIVPTIEMDTMWHFHILDTRAYHADSEQVFGEYFHHFPYFGMRSDEDEADLTAAFKETCALYEKEFGQELLRAAGAQKCWHDCQGRCWHACKN